jgi:MFS transporter, NNP family, nitrate/nitrite transporter
MSDYLAIKGKGLAFLSLLWSLWFVVMVVRMIVGPLLPLVEDEFGVRHATATTLVSLFALGGALSTLASGVFGGRIGYKRMILASLGASVIVFLLIPHVRTFSQLAALLFALGFVWSTYFPCVIPIVTTHFAPSVWGRALAIQDSGASLSALAAPLLVTLMLPFVSWRQFFYVFAAAYLVSGVVFLLFAREVRVEQRITGSLRNLLKNGSVWIMAVVWVCASGAFWGVYQVTPLYFTKELSLSSEYANTIFGLSRIGGIVFGVMMGFVVDRFSLKRSMFTVMCLTGVFTMLIGHRNLIVVQSAMFLQSTSIMGLIAIGLAAISRLFRMEERSMATGLLTTMGSVLGSGILPYLFGLAGDHLSFRFAMIVFGAIVILCSSLIHFLVFPARQEGRS